MNKIKNILLAGVLSFCAFAAVGQQLPQTIAQPAFSACTTNGQGTASYVVISANSANGGVPVVTYLNAASDLANSRIQFYRVDAYTSATYTNSTVTLPVVQTNSIADGGTIVIRHVAEDTYEKRTLTTSTGSTNLVVTAAPLGTVVPGDIIYHVTSTRAPCIRWGASTNSIGPSNGMIAVGQAGYPLLLDINATSLGEINIVSGFYMKPN